jgi:hypothetical protein
VTSAVPEVIELALRRRGLTLRETDGEALPLVQGWGEAQQQRFYQELLHYSGGIAL